MSLSLSVKFCIFSCESLHCSIFCETGNARFTCQSNECQDWSFAHIGSLFFPYFSICVLAASVPLSRFSSHLSLKTREAFTLTREMASLALHGSKSLTRCRRFSPLDSLSVLLAPTCLDCNDTPPINLTLASRPNKAFVNMKNVFRDIFLSAPTGYCNCQIPKIFVL